MTPVSAPAPSGLPLAGTGVDAAGTVGPSHPAVSACTTPGRNTVGGVGPGGAGEGSERTAGPLRPHYGLGMAVHVHSTRDERLACQADHDAAMARLLLAGEVA